MRFGNVEWVFKVDTQLEAERMCAFMRLAGIAGWQVGTKGLADPGNLPSGMHRP